MQTSGASKNKLLDSYGQGRGVGSATRWLSTSCSYHDRLEDLGSSPSSINEEPWWASLFYGRWSQDLTHYNSSSELLFDNSLSEDGGYSTIVGHSYRETRFPLTDPAFGQTSVAHGTQLRKILLQHIHRTTRSSNAFQFGPLMWGIELERGSAVERRCNSTYFM